MPQLPRVVEACAACGRQYDVTHLERGQRVRCTCGGSIEVRRIEPHAPRSLRCTNCGGNLVEGARKCAYCSAEITLREQRLDAVCPACFARSASASRFCMECGVRIEAQVLFALAEGQGCPRCEGELRQRAIGSSSLVECSACGGLWLSAGQFERLCRRSEAEAVAPGMFASGRDRREIYERQKYIPCLSCKALMLRRNYAGSSGVVIDACREHGVWLDADELERILQFVRAGGLDHARQRQIERLREQETRARAAQQAAGSAPERTTSLQGQVFGAGLEIGLFGLLELFGD